MCTGLVADGVPVKGPMHAEAVWRVWRRILRDPVLSSRILQPSTMQEETLLGLSGEDLCIAKAYAAQSRGAPLGGRRLPLPACELCPARA
jgi:hypothetical protein